MRDVMLAVVAALLALGCGGRPGARPGDAEDAGLVDGAAADRRADAGDGGAAAVATPVLFGGGICCDSQLADTWSWAGGAWHEVQGPGPSARQSSAMATVSGHVVLFGGWAGNDLMLSPGDLGDTWTFSGVAWTQRSVAGPPARESAVMTAVNDALVLFGGEKGCPGLCSPLADTWTWDGAAWTQQQVTGPSARFGAVMATLGGTAVLFGGTDGSPTALGDTWTWDGRAWAQLHAAGPPARFAAVMAPARGKLVLFGGTGYQGGNTTFGDTWTWDGTAWTEVAGPGPSARFGAAMTVSGDQLVLAAGQDQHGNALADTWTWNGTAWTQRAVTGPSARFDAAMATVDGIAIPAPAPRPVRRENGAPP
jgi:hypothetical protein